MRGECRFLLRLELVGTLEAAKVVEYLPHSSSYGPSIKHTLVQVGGDSYTGRSTKSNVFNWTFKRLCKQYRALAYMLSQTGVHMAVLLITLYALLSVPAHPNVLALSTA